MANYGVIERPTDEECYLYAIMTDPSGIDLAEFSWYDGSSSSPDGCFRAYDYQWPWWRNHDTHQIEMSARAIGKTFGILVRMFSFPFSHPNEEALVTAPQLVHLEPIIKLIERRFQTQRLGREVVLKDPTHRPFTLEFKNNARILGRIPQRDGVGVKGTHPAVLEQEEASDYPYEGWIELTETLNRSAKNATWHAHGVTIGVGNEFHRHSEHALGEDPLRPISHQDEALFTVHRIPAMFHPDWSDLERRRKHNQYPDESEYRRNVLGLPGDAMNPIFPANALWRCVEDDQSAEFNTQEYWHVTIKDVDVDTQQRGILNLLRKPPEHADYKPIWVGLDYGLLGDPTEILIFSEMQLTAAERKIMKSRGKACPEEGFSRLKMIGRITLIKILEPAQAEVIMWICDNYEVKRFAFDATGIGLPLFQYIKYQASDPDPSKVRRAKKALDAIWGYNFSSNILVDFDERIEPDAQRIDEKIKNQGIERNVKEYSTDVARVYVSDQRMWFPWDVDFMKELQMSKYRFERDQIDRYGRRKRAFSGGMDHCLDALRMVVLGHRQFSIDTFVANQEADPVIEMFIDQSEFMMFGGVNSSQMNNPDEYAGGYDIEFGGYSGDYGGVPTDWQDTW